MRRIAMLIPVLLAAAVVVAQGAKGADELVAQLGHEDYEVREKATLALIDLGEDAVPALEEALKSDDLEVRLRAGRALRAIRGDSKRKVEKEEAEERQLPGRRATASSVSIQMLPGKIRVTVKEVVDGKEVTKTYEAANQEELLKKHPELKRHFGNGGFRFRMGRGRDPFDMDKFWDDWSKDFDEHFKRLHEENQREMERLRRWMDLARKHQQQRQDRLRRQADPRAERSAHQLGVRARLPDPVLNAQLQLRGRGLVVEAVEKDTPADALGLERYDVVLQLNGRDIRRIEDVALVMRELEEGEALTASVIRGGAPKQLSTTR